MNVNSVQNFVAFAVNNLTLFVKHIIIFKHIFTCTKVHCFHFLLCRFKEPCQNARLQRHIFISTENNREPVFHSVFAKTLWQIVFKRDKEYAWAWVALTSGTTTQLIVNTTRFMTFSAQNVKTTKLNNLFLFFVGYLFKIGVVFVVFVFQNFFFVSQICIVRSDFFHHSRFNVFVKHFLFCQKFWVTTKQNICTTTSHVSCNCNLPNTTRLRNNLTFKFMVFCIQKVVRNAQFFNFFAYAFRFVNRSSTNQNRLTFFIFFLNFFNNCIVFCLFSVKDKVLFINTLHRLICWNGNNIQVVNFVKFTFFSFCSTSHAAQFRVKFKVVLKGDCCQSFVFFLHFNAFFGFNCLVQAVAITSALHNTAGKFINNQHFIIFNNVVDVAFHNIICTQSVVDMVVDFKVLDITQVFKFKISFCLANTSFS